MWQLPCLGSDGGFFLHPFLFPEGSMTAYKRVCSLHYFYEHPLEGWTLHEDRSCPVPLKRGQFTSCSLRTTCGWSQFVSMIGMSLTQVLAGEWCCRRVGGEWGLGDRWMLISCELSKLFRIAVYPIGSVWLLGKLNLLPPALAFEWWQFCGSSGT